MKKEQREKILEIGPYIPEIIWENNETRFYFTCSDYLNLVWLNDSWYERVFDKWIWGVLGGVLLIFFGILLIIWGSILILKGRRFFIDWILRRFRGENLVIRIIFDSWSIIFRGVVLFITGNVLAFSVTYIWEDEKFRIFLKLLILFVLRIIILIFIPNLIIILLGWDGLGIISYLLVVYYQNYSSLRAGILTVLRNRIGDGFLLISIGLLLTEGRLEIVNLKRNEQWLVGLLLVLAAFTKRAQFPFCSWLPAAIAAPTPVSALVHSSTLVTAGVFILIRIDRFLKECRGYYLLLIIISRITIILRGMRALYETDLKKIIALSTLSQLGVIIGSLGVGAVDFAIFHLITHALFKALIFLGAGLLIWFNEHWQDLRKVKINHGRYARSSQAGAGLALSRVALCGFPWLGGFYSKDKILEFAFGREVNLIVIIIFGFATILTRIYSFRLCYYCIYWGKFGIFVWTCWHERRTYGLWSYWVIFYGVVLLRRVLNWVLFFKRDLRNCGEEKNFALILVGLGWWWFTFEGYKRLKLTWLIDFRAFIWFLTPLSTQWLLIRLPKIKIYIYILDQGWQEILGGVGGKKIGVYGNFIINSFQNIRIVEHLFLGLFLGGGLILIW